MSEDQENKEDDGLGSTGLVRFINSLLEIKLPEIVKKNLITATGKLIMGAVDIPVAWMESKAKQIRSETDALGKVTEASGISAAQAFNIDPELQARSIDYWGSKLLKKQLNREEVYWQAMQDLEQNPPKEDSDYEIDEDWLGQFGEIADNKSNKEVKLILAKILAGEIRQSGTFSPRTLDAIKFLDHKTAIFFLHLTSISVCVRGFRIVWNRPLELDSWLKLVGFDYPETGLMLLQEQGLIGTGTVETFSYGISDKHYLGNTPVYFKYTTGINKRFSAEVFIYSTIGFELAQAVNPKFSKEVLFRYKSLIGIKHQNCGLRLMYKTKSMKRFTSLRS